MSYDVGDRADAPMTIGALSRRTGVPVKLLREYEIRAVTGDYLDHPDRPIGPRLAEVVVTVRARTRAQIVELEGLLRRLDVFETRFAAELAGESDRDFREDDPRSGRARPWPSPGGQTLASAPR
jgi:hypothetical protein